MSALLIMRYIFFAALATVANLLVQRAVMYFGDTWITFWVAVGSGTLVGLIIKYLLDKRWIFFETSIGAIKNAQNFSLYTAVGLVTTFIFWGTESAFWLIWETDTMREIGATLGLTMGYFFKYHLDKRFVFVNRHLTIPT